MQIKFQKSEDEMIIFFEDDAICLEFSFRQCENLDIDKLVQFKGLLHSRQIPSLVQSVVIDRAGTLSLSYQDGGFWVKMEHDGTRLVLPVCREAYNRLEYLLDQLIG